MGRVWLGATHSSRPTGAGTPATGGTVGRALVPQPAQQHHQRDGAPPAPGSDSRPRWVRWLAGHR
jgi:hypothetical protein